MPAETLLAFEQLVERGRVVQTVANALSPYRDVELQSSFIVCVRRMLDRPGKFLRQRGPWRWFGRARIHEGAKCMCRTSVLIREVREHVRSGKPSCAGLSRTVFEKLLHGQSEAVGQPQI